MFLSMTGFASRTESFKVGKDDKISLSIDLKSINTRFFECSCKLPNILSSLEIKVIHRLKSKLLRGRVFLNVRILDTEGGFTKITPSTKLLDEYLKAINSIKKQFNLTGKLTVSDILNLPNIFSSQNIEIDKKTKDAFLKTIDKLADDLIKDRSIEGAELKKDLEKRFTVCSKKITEIKKRFKIFVKEHKEEIKKILASYQKDADEESKLKLDELYSILNKIDVHEEIIRFESHLKNAKNILKDQKIEKGKRLDFTLQELLRESNTILAKCSDFDISTLAVDIKVELEKIREQAQNIV
ncbi:YicC family protein [Candidatus Dependentiae bacterium]|nr:YicC family protein [Candidatus Dependentiae bacterium]